MPPTEATADRFAEKTMENNMLPPLIEAELTGFNNVKTTEATENAEASITKHIPFNAYIVAAELELAKVEWNGIKVLH